MKILFLTQYCPPEVGAPQNRIFELAKGLQRNGHQVTILTAMPNYPVGEVFEGYRGKILMEEELEGIRVVRTWIYTTPSKGFIARLMNYFSFTLTSVLLGLWKVGKHDIIFTESPPLFLGGSGYILSVLLQSKYIFNVSDLWPESAVKLGVLKNEPLIKMSTMLEEFCYDKADLISGQTRGIVENIASRGYQREKIFLLTNGVDTTLFSKAHRDEKLRAELGIAGKFALVYAGIHGLAQGLEVMVRTAERLRDYPEIAFVFVGEGPEKELLIDLTRELGLTNVHFLPLQKKKDMPRLLAAMDATIIPLKKLDLFKGALPSKMFEALASELPIVLAVDGEARVLIEAAEAGIYVEPENVDEMSAAVLKLYQNPDLVKKLGANGRVYVEENYSRKRILEKFEERLLALLKGGK